eukprot:9489434-Pyramimonas_sp.AAC.1
MDKGIGSGSPRARASTTDGCWAYAGVFMAEGSRSPGAVSNASSMRRSDSTSSSSECQIALTGVALVILDVECLTLTGTSTSKSGPGGGITTSRCF